MWKLIAAVDAKWGIGKNNRLLVQIPGDQQLFRQRTMGQVVVMGRKTLDSLPNGMALQGRENLVLTRKMDYAPKGVKVFHDIESLVYYLDGQEKEVYVIGGGDIYHQLLPYCDKAYITKIDHIYEVDTWCPNLDENPEWNLVSESDEKTYFDLEYCFLEYERRG